MSLSVFILNVLVATVGAYIAAALLPLPPRGGGPASRQHLLAAVLRRVQPCLRANLP
jgi:hypothetical protein